MSGRVRRSHPEATVDNRDLGERVRTLEAEVAALRARIAALEDELSVGETR